MSGVYDYIVVGAGSSGCALARRLSDNPGVSVALVEAGGADDRAAIGNPTEYFHLWGTDVDWQYLSTPQAGTNDRVHNLPRGRVLGGTSSINGMVYLRGARGDYDAWAERGCTGWDWDNVRRNFEELEELLLPAVLGDHNPLSDVFLTACVQAGYAANPFFDSGELDGAGWNRSSIHDGRRHSSYRAFVAPVLDRPNLTILTDTVVDRVLVDKAGNVSGIETRAGRIESAHVVLSAGTFESPRLLLSSGIGPARHLESVGLKPVIDLPVGENLIDHLLIGVVYTSTRELSLAHAFVTECCAFARVAPARDAPDVEISFAKEPAFAPPADDDLHRYTIIPGITHPRSRGTVRLRSADPADPPVIDPNYLSEPQDMQTLIQSVRMTREIGAAAAFEEWNAGEFFPGTQVESDEAIADYVRGSISTWFHPVGTCRMGIGVDAVVDPQLGVVGTTGLHVADASIMPDVVSVNTNAASMMIGWRAGELLLRS